MVNISTELKNKYKDDGSHHVSYYVEFYYVMEMEGNTPFLTLGNGQIVQESLNLQEGISGGDYLELGSVYTSEITFDAADISTALSGKYMKVYQMIDDMTEPMPLGRFIVTSVTKTSDRRIKTIMAYDYTTLFDEDGHALLEKMKDCKIVQDALNVLANHYGLQWETQTIQGADYPLVWDYEQAKDDNFIAKDIVAMLGEILGGWIKCNRDGKLYLKTIGAPILSEMETVEYARSNPDYEESEIGTIDNVIFTDIDDVTYGASNGTNTVDLSGNYFLTGGTAESINKFLTLALNNISGIKYYPAELSIDARPYMECGDYIKFRDRGRELYTLIKERSLTGIQAQVDSYTCNISTSAQEAGYVSSAAKQAATMDVVKRVNYNLQKAQQDLANALANSAGLYDTKIIQEDGSYILYLHDKKELSESHLVIKVTIEAIGFSTDGGKTYPFGLMINGDVIARILAAEGINANWINAGSIKIGGSSSNADGAIEIYDVNDNLICKIDKNGLVAVLGEIAGWIISQNQMTSPNGQMVIDSLNRRIVCGDGTGTKAVYDEAGEGIYYNNEELGHFGFSKIYWTDDNGNVTANLRGIILENSVTNSDTCMGYAITAWSQKDEWYQRMMFYDSHKEKFSFYRDVEMLRHAETDPYYTKDITWTSSTTFTATVGTPTGQVKDFTNNFTVEKNASGRIVKITNDTKGITTTLSPWNGG